MQTEPVTKKLIASSVIAVPPLARDNSLLTQLDENKKIASHIEAGGVRILLYGGNANFYHIGMSEYADVLAMLGQIAATDTLVIPSAGPSFGMMMDQADAINDTDFPTVMVLPQQEVTTSFGIATGLRKFAEKVNRPIVLYLKHDRILSVDDATSLVDDGIVSFIKYAVVRDVPSNDDYLSQIVDRIDPKMIVSGIGEQPAIDHLQKFGLNGFTSGCVCVAPKLSMKMLAAIKEGNLDDAERIRKIFLPLEDLRNSINPIRVLHEAVTAAGIASTGPHLPLLSPIEDQQQQAKIKSASLELLSRNHDA